MNKTIAKLSVIASLLITTQTFAALTQIVQVGNMVYNTKPSVMPGATPTAVTIKFFSGSQTTTACDTKTAVAFGAGVVVSPGAASGTVGATTCTALITGISATPVTASTTIGAIYNAPASTYTVAAANNPDKQIIQVLIIQKARTGSPYAYTYYGPAFNADNGTVTTPGDTDFVDNVAFDLSVPSMKFMN